MILLKQITINLWKNYQMTLRTFIESWENKSDWGIFPLFNFLLPCPYFYDIELFNEKVSILGDEDFLFHFFSESIPLTQIEELVKNPSALHSFEETILWDSDQKRAFIIEFISNLAIYRECISKLVIGNCSLKGFE